MSTPNKKDDFGTRLKELEAITTWFESDEVDLNAALSKFERGMELADGLKKELAEIENRVEVIKQRFDDGAPSSTATSSAVDPAAEPPSASSSGGQALF